MEQEKEIIEERNDVPQADTETRRRGKMVRTSLDNLPNGTDKDVPDVNSKITHSPLPEGISSGSLYGDIFRIAGPSFIELVLTQLTSMADQIMVGQLPGTMGVAALSAVGISMQPKFLLMTMIMALNVGATAMVARFRGRGDQKRANILTFFLLP